MIEPRFTRALRRALTVVFFVTLFAPAFAADSAAPVRWKAVLMSAGSDEGLKNWDNARVEIGKRLNAYGVASNDIVMLSAHPDFLRPGVRKATGYNLKFAIEDLNLKQGDALLVFVTSHGSENGGIKLSASNAWLSIATLKDCLSIVPSKVPTVLVLSACYSGQFIDGIDTDSSSRQGDLRSPQRVILTAARNDRTSFGCGSGQQMTEFDESFLRSLETLGPRVSWKTLYEAVARDVADKEAGYDENEKSLPQFFVGADVRSLLTP